MESLAHLPEEQFRLYAVCARHPRVLFEEIAAEEIQPGVYTCRRGSDAIRIIVVADLPKTQRNASLHLFSAAADKVQYGAEHYHFQLSDTSTVINTLFLEYRQEGLVMPYTMVDFKRDLKRKFLDEATPEELEEMVQRLTPEQLAAALYPEQIEALTKHRRQTPSVSPKKKPKPKKWRIASAHSNNGRLMPHPRPLLLPTTHYPLAATDRPRDFTARLPRVPGGHVGRTKA
jgi:hypothetical protein